MITQRERPHHLQPALESVRLLLVYKDFAGRGFSHAGLGVSCMCTAKALRRHGVWADVWASSSADDLRRRLHAVHAQAVQRNEVLVTHVVIAAPWIATAELARLAMEFPEIVWTVTCHSNVGFLAADCEAIRLMRETAELQHLSHNVRAAGNCERMTRWASRAWGTQLALLPNIYDLSEAVPARRSSWRGDVLRVGMFGAARLLKNGVTGAAALAALANKLRVPVELHVSSGRDEGGSLRPIEEITRNVPNLVLKRAGWLSWPAFKASVRQMHLHLQPSYTESFNVTVADAIAASVPSVVGPAIHWVPSHWKADIDDPTDVARVAEALLHDVHAADDGRQALERYVRDALAAWERFLCARCGDHRPAHS